MVKTPLSDTIDKYDNALLRKARELSCWRGEIPLSLDDMAFLLQWTIEQGPLTTARISTLKLIRAHFNLTASAASFFDLKLSMLQH
jgi:hypothetical protein